MCATEVQLWSGEPEDGERQGDGGLWAKSNAMHGLALVRFGVCVLGVV